MKCTEKLFKMYLIPTCLLLTNVVMQCSAIGLHEQLKHVIRRRAESLGLLPLGLVPYPTRKAFDLQSDSMANIVGAPDLPSHLPPSEPIMPGHTLLRPAFGMLKSAVKFPHTDLVERGIYGNMKHVLSMKYDGRNERILYSDFRRNNGNQNFLNEEDEMHGRGNMDFMKKMHLKSSREVPSENKSLKKLLVMLRKNKEMNEFAENNMFFNTRRSLSERPMSLNLDESEVINHQTTSMVNDEKINDDKVNDEKVNDESTVNTNVARKADVINCDSNVVHLDNWYELLKDRFSEKKIDMTKPTYSELFPMLSVIAIGRERKKPEPVDHLNTQQFNNLKLYKHYSVNPDYQQVFDHPDIIND